MEEFVIPHPHSFILSPNHWNVFKKKSFKFRQHRFSPLLPTSFLIYLFFHLALFATYFHDNIYIDIQMTCEPTIHTFGHSGKVWIYFFPSVTDVTLVHLAAEDAR